MDERLMKDLAQRTVAALHASHYRADKDFLTALYDSLAAAFGHGVSAGLRIAFDAQAEGYREKVGPFNRIGTE